MLWTRFSQVMLGLGLPGLLVACQRGQPVGHDTALSAARAAQEELPPEPKVRRPAAAGGFYPGSAEALGRQVDDCLEKAEAPELPGRLVAVMAPHAGYVYSGGVAGYAYKLLQKHPFQTAILIGLSHGYPHAGGALDDADFWETPLGRVPVNTALRDRLRDSGAGFEVEPLAHLREHSVEVQLPFLQRIWTEFDIVPITFRQLTPGQREKIADALAEVMKGRDDVVLITSTDMTHYPAYDEAVKCDQATLKAIATLDADKVETNEMEWVGKGIPDLVCTLCGLEGVLVTLEVLDRLGVKGVKVLKYANSGDVPIGDKSRVVGYGAVAFYRTGEAVEGTARSEKSRATSTAQGSAQRPEEKPVKNEELLSEAERKELLKLARLSLEKHVRREKMPPVEVQSARLKEKGAAFVTLKKHGELRGCIGHLEARLPLYQTVIEMAAAAALQDTRFLPVRPEELADIDLEISYLTPMREITDVNEIEVGRHGIYITQGFRSGVLLPQVATEQGWDRDTFLQHTCLKAGLPPDAWKHGARIEIFTAQVFGEKEEG